ncbi:MAG: transcriptional regulator [Polaromonas sp.]|nr:transcriptional regulator [Polaromonas sp.]
MKIERIKIDLNLATSLPLGQVDERRLDATTEQDAVAQEIADDVDALHDAAQFVRRVRKRLGLTQLEFSYWINESLPPTRDWEKDKRCPTGAAKALLKVFIKIPESALRALS